MTQKMKSHSKSEVYLLSCQLDVEADGARKEGSIISQAQNVGEANIYKIEAIEALLRCSHFLAHQHITHTTNFDKLVELVSCGGETLQTFLDKAGGNTTYTSKIAVVEFVIALGTWVENLYSSGFIRHPPFFSIMADEC